MSKRAFITGGTGFVGLNLVESLVKDGWEVTALHRPTSNLTYIRRFPVALVEGSVTDPASLERAMPEDLDALFHVAGNTSLNPRDDAEQTRVNVEGTRNVVETALSKKARRFVHTSTVAAYGFHDTPITEETPSNAKEVPINYFRTKALAEDEVRKGIERGLDAVIVNPTNVMGPYDSRNWARAVLMVHAGKVPGIGPGRGSFCHAREVARGHIAAVDKGGRGENYLLGGADASYVQLTQVIAEVVGGKAPKKALPAGVLRLGARVLGLLAALTGREPLLTPEQAIFISKSMVASSEKAERVLGYRPVPLKDMVRDCAEWLRAEGLLEAA